MTSRTLARSATGCTYVLVFETGDEVMEGLTGWCREQRITAARLTAIGACSDLLLGWFDLERKEYREIPVDEQVEVLSLTGDVALADGKPSVHAHVVVGSADGSTRGGHLLRAHVRPTLEVVVDETPAYLRKRHDPRSGLALIAPAA
jgi:predicted DNA-binding protein with PD1-like motif